MQEIINRLEEINQRDQGEMARLREEVASLGRVIQQKDKFIADLKEENQLT